MGILRSLFGRGGDTIKQGEQTNRPTIPTEVKSFDVAMTQSAFWASVRLLTETVSAMPLVCYEKTNNDTIQNIKTDYPLWELLNYEPNRYQTRTEFFEQVMLNLVTWGNAYIIKQQVGTRITGLTVYPSEQVKMNLLHDGSITYEYVTPSGNVKVFAEKSIWHIKLFGNGLVGMSPLAYAGNALGISKNLGDRQSKLAGNGGKVNGILTIDSALTKEQRLVVKENFKTLNEGNKDELFILEAGFKYQQTGLSPTDQQLLESRRFSVEDIARFMGVPSVLINDTASSTTWGSGIEQINMGFYKLNLKPYLERIESSIKRHLIPRKDWQSIDIEFDFDSLLRADSLTRADTYSKAVNSGQMTPNEVRALEGRPPKTGGDEIYLNGSLVPAGTRPKQSEVFINGN
jgi:HK97 family phage portal protein